MTQCIGTFLRYEKMICKKISYPIPSERVPIYVPKVPAVTDISGIDSTLNLEIIWPLRLAVGNISLVNRPK